jgi:hypothetical protein
MSLPIFHLNILSLDSVSMSQNQSSLIHDLGEVSGFAVHSIFTGTPVGTLIVEASNDTDTNNFVAIDSYAITEDGKRLLNIEKSHYKYVRVRYEFTSGSGTLTTRVSGKRV